MHDLLIDIFKSYIYLFKFGLTMFGLLVTIIFLERDRG